MLLAAEHEQQQPTPQQLSGLQVTILNVQSCAPPVTDGGSAAGCQTWPSCLYCTCEIPGKPLSHMRTLLENSAAVDSGWTVAWDFTSDVPNYVIGDSLTFTVWEHDQSEDMSTAVAGQCSGTDSILGRVSVMHAALTAISPATSRPGSGDSNVSAAANCSEWELPLEDTASGFSAVLRVKVSPLAIPEQSQQCKSYAGQWAESSHTSLAAVPNDVTGLDAPKHTIFADTVAKAVATNVNTTFQKLLTEALTSHMQHLEKTLVEEFRKSEVQVMEKISKVLSPRKVRSVPASRFVSLKSQPQSSGAGVKPKSQGADSAATFKGTASKEYRPLRTGGTDDGASNAESANSIGYGHKSEGVYQSEFQHRSERSTAFGPALTEGRKDKKRSGDHHDDDDDRAVPWKHLLSSKSSAACTKKTFGDMESLHRDRILESFGLVSGPPAPALEKSARRPSITSSRHSESRAPSIAGFFSRSKSVTQETLELGMSGSSQQKLNRARAKLRFVTALTSATRKEPSPEQEMAPNSSSSGSKDSTPEQHEKIPTYSTEKTEKSVAIASVYPSAAESEGRSDDVSGLKLPLPGNVANTLEVPGGGSRGSSAPGSSDTEEMHVMITDNSDAGDAWESNDGNTNKIDFSMLSKSEAAQMTQNSPRWLSFSQSRSLPLGGCSSNVLQAKYSTESAHNMTSVRLHQEEMLTQRSLPLSVKDPLETAVFLPKLMMMLNGIIVSTDCQAAEAIFWVQLLLNIGTLFLSVKFVSDGVNSPYCGAASAVLSAGGLAGLISFRFNSIRDVLIPLSRYSRIHVFYSDWMTSSRRTSYVVLLIWLGVLLLQNTLPVVSGQVQCKGGISEAGSPSRWPVKWVTKVFPYATFAHTSTIFLALLHTQFHILACLQLMLDSFCRRLFEGELLDAFVPEWNVLQAMLRRSARTVEHCFLIVQTSSLCALVLGAVGLWQDAPRTCGSEWIVLAMEHAPVLLLGLTALGLFIKAAAVTEQCTRVPSLINSMDLDDPVDETRQYVVNYIINSNAGFYVRDVRLTSFMAIKITYILLAAMVGLIVQLLRV